jgi:hypothetical protein
MGLDTLLSDFLNRVEKLGEDKLKAKTQLFEVYDGKTYLRKSGELVPVRPEMPQQPFTSLDGILDYALTALGSAPKGQLVYTVSPRMVRLIEPQVSEENRPFRPVFTYAEAVPVVANLGFLGQWLPQDEAIIKITTSFQHDDAAKDLLATLGTLILDEAITTEDDGVTQNVTAKAGIKMGKKVPLGLMTLKPYETFAEVQLTIPGRIYNVRVKKEGITASISLHTNQDPKVDLAISQEIKNYLVRGLVSRGMADSEAKQMVAI